MYPLPPPPPTPSPPLPQQFKQIDVKREAADQHLLPPELPISSKRQFGGYSKLQNSHRTNPIIWCLAIFCMIFSILLILFGIATLIIFVGLKPRTPLFDTPGASLTVVYIDSAESAQFLNSDFTFMANFSNPNRKLDITFEYLKFELYSFDTLIAAQVLEPFTQARRQTRLVTIQMISSLVYFPPNHAVELQKQMPIRAHKPTHRGLGSS
ncbi:OLC1v1022396C1 [Oldenlandia corymbosa var. corymbosa]|uniref:OLC1v1022396C1 n=1 Tax=Oldenlandia corymbosa var. corymbosa TaxID=529605 RepID=A0AAV1BYF0_OLDCO|nr:OLC1v1022396C1 [Oldenlandia corymbosa var. corymbosa]